MNKLATIKTEELSRTKAAYMTAAKLVVLHGEMYLPIFERLHKEMNKTESMLNLRLLAAQYVQA